MMLLRNLLFFVLCVGWSAQLQSQNYNFQIYNLEQGLPQSEVRVIADDHLGYLWIGTVGGGLCRFNGKSFDVFNRRNGLPDNVIFSLTQDRKKNLWVVTTRGIVRYDGLGFKPVVVADSTLFSAETRLVETASGRLWFIANFGSGRRLFYIEHDSLFDAGSAYPEIFRENTLYFLNEWSKKRAILSTQKGIFLIDRNEIVPDDLNRRMDTRNQIVIPLIEDRQKAVWVVVVAPSGSVEIRKLNTSGEFEKVKLPEGVDSKKLFNLMEDREGGLWTSVAQKGLMYHKGDQSILFSSDNGLPSSIIHTVFQDNEGNFWFGSSGDGLIRYTNNFFTILNEASGLTDNLIMRMFEDSNGTKYFADGTGGLNVFNGKDLKAYPAHFQPDLGMINGFAESPQGILLATGSGLWQFASGKFSRVHTRYGLTTEPLLSLETRGDTLYVGTLFSGIRKCFGGRVVETIDVRNSGLVSNSIQYFYFDKKGNVWACSAIGMSRISPDGKIRTFTEKDGLNGLNVMQIAEDRVGNLWLATFTGGLHRFDGTEFKVYDSTNGLKTDIVYSVLTDLAGNIWSGSQLGVEQLEISSDGSVKQINRYDRFDGFTGIENNASAALCDQKGVLWFGTINGVVRCLPGERSLNHMPPPVYLRDVSLNGKTVDWSSEPYRQYCDSVVRWFNVPSGLVLPPRYSQIRFTFDALCFTQPEKVQFRYRLEPLDAEFSESQSRNSVTYSALPPGDYELHVLASNNDGVWTAEAISYRFQVRYSWWQSPLMKFAMGIVLILGITLLIWAVYYRNLRHKQELETLSLSKQLELNKLKSMAGEVERENQILQKQVIQSKGKLEVWIRLMERVNELLQTSSAKMTEERWVAQLFAYLHEALAPQLFAFACKDASGEALVFKYAYHKGERLPVFSYPIDDSKRLVVKAFLARKEVWVRNFDLEMNALGVELRPVPGGGQTQSLWIAPVGAQWLITLQYECADAFDPEVIQILNLIAKAIGARFETGAA